MGEIKKRRKALLEALQGFFRSDEHNKQLKKARAFRAFIQKLEDRRTTLAGDLEADDLTEQERRSLERQLEVLDAQLPKARQLLADMDAKEQRQGE